LREEPFSRFLEDNGMRMTLDTIVDKDVSQPVAAAWHDYRNVDVVLAMRPASDRAHTHKPATKLYNSWLAGVPAVLSPDYAFRELRRGPLDYIEVQSVDEARAALLKLRRDPALYQAMVDNGRVSGRDFTADAIADRWQTLLYETLPPLVAARPRWQGDRFGRAVIGVGRKLRRTLSGGARR
jgi:hypothetical protein